MIYIRPQKGLKVICPTSFKPLNPKGEWVLRSSYWKRRLASGEVEVIKPVREVKKVTSKKEEEDTQKTK